MNPIRLLTWMGVVPFTLSLTSHWLDMPFGMEYSGLQAFALYSVIILCFMSGTLWGQSITQPNHPDQSKALVGSIAITLIALFAYMLLAPIAVVLLATFLYVGLIALEGYFGRSNRIVLSSYWRLRIQVTFVVCFHHLAVLIIWALT